MLYTKSPPQRNCHGLRLSRKHIGSLTLGDLGMKPNILQLRNVSSKKFWASQKVEKEYLRHNQESRDQSLSIFDWTPLEVGLNQSNQPLYLQRCFYKDNWSQYWFKPKGISLRKFFQKKQCGSIAVEKRFLATKWTDRNYHTNQFSSFNPVALWQRRQTNRHTKELLGAG